MAPNHRNYSTFFGVPGRIKGFVILSTAKVSSACSGLASCLKLRALKRLGLQVKAFGLGFRFFKV